MCAWKYKNITRVKGECMWESQSELCYGPYHCLLIAYNSYTWHVGVFSVLLGHVFLWSMWSVRHNCMWLLSIITTKKEIIRKTSWNLVSIAAQFSPLFLWCWILSSINVPSSRSRLKAYFTSDMTYRERRLKITLFLYQAVRSAACQAVISHS